jgi:simple sugar transport system substrate-binding protein
VRNAWKLAAGSLALVLPLLSGACAGETAGPAPVGPVKIGFITKFAGDFYGKMVAAVTKYDAEHSDVDVVFGQGRTGTDDESAIQFIESMVAAKVDAIAITPTSPNVRTALDRAVAAGIKIVLIDNDIPGWAGKSTVVATDNRAGGKLAGEWLAEHLVNGGTVAVLQGRLGNPSLDDRVTGMKEGLGDRATVIAETATDCDEVKGLNATTDILANHPDVEAIYGACGPPTTGALQAIKAANKQRQVTLVGFDATTAEVAAISAGDQAGSVAQFPAKMGAMGIEAAVTTARGGAVAPTIDTGVEMVTKVNVAKYK